MAMTFHSCNRMLVAGAILSLCCGAASGSCLRQSKLKISRLRGSYRTRERRLGCAEFTRWMAKIAWASGSGGTVLKTTDSGGQWRKCAVPGADGERLDLRGVQAWDALTAIVMASGPGDKSRLYKTIDGLQELDASFQESGQSGWFFRQLLDRLIRPGVPAGRPRSRTLHDLSHQGPGSALAARATRRPEHRDRRSGRVCREQRLYSARRKRSRRGTGNPEIICRRRQEREFCFFPLGRSLHHGDRARQS